MITKNYKSILDLMKAFPTNESCIKHLEKLRWNGDIISPFDKDSKVYRCKHNRYRCKNTGKYFNVRTGTILDNTKIELQKWFLGTWLVTSHKKGISSMQLARDLDITQKSAWFMLQKIRSCFGIENNSQLKGEVEVDETYIGGKSKNRHKNKRGLRNQGRSTIDKTAVLGLVERGGKVVANKVDNTSARTITPKVLDTVAYDTKIYTDEHSGYYEVAAIYDYGRVCHKHGEYVNGDCHTNTIEGFWSLLKRNIVGIYHSTSRKHLQMYVDECVFKYNTRHLQESRRFNLLLENCYHRLTYKQLTHG